MYQYQILKNIKILKASPACKDEQISRGVHQCAAQTENILKGLHSVFDASIGHTIRFSDQCTAV